MLYRPYAIKSMFVYVHDVIVLRVANCNSCRNEWMGGDEMRGGMITHWYGESCQ